MAGIQWYKILYTQTAVKDLEDKANYISTAGGAFLEVLEGKTLPAVAALEARADS